MTSMTSSKDAFALGTWPSCRRRAPQSSANSATRSALPTLTSRPICVHLKRPEEAGYVAQEKRFIGKKPPTRVFLTDKGRKAWIVWIQRMEALIKAPE